MNVIECALDESEPVVSRLEAIDNLIARGGLTDLVALVSLAQRQHEDRLVSERAGSGIAHILNVGVMFDQFELRDFSPTAGDAFAKTWEGTW